MENNHYISTANPFNMKKSKPDYSTAFRRNTPDGLAFCLVGIFCLKPKNLWEIT